MLYLALLRGINVGGHNKVEMRKLRSTFESLGFKNVATYINSGNIIFEYTSHEQNVIVNKIEEAIKRDSQLELKVLIRNREEMEFIFQELPVTWVKNDLIRTDILFLWDKYDLFRSLFTSEREGKRITINRTENGTT